MIRRTGIFLRTSVGKKVLMSLTGIALLGFLVVHLAGNTLLYAGDGGEAFDGYANALKSKPLLLYSAEIGLLALFVAHIVLALRLTLENRDARPERYRIRSSHGEKTVGSTSMIVTGSVVLVFLVIHLLDFRLDSRAEDGMYVLVVERLSTFAGFAIYMVGVGALLIHLGHAVRSALQSLGVNHPQYNAVLKIGGRALAVILFLLDRRPGRHQRRQELPQRRRQHLPALLRHGQGRRLPRPRGQRLPAGAGLQPTSSTSASPRACRSRASTAGCSTTVPSAAPRCRAPSTPRPDRPAAPARRLPGADATGRSAPARSRCTRAHARCSIWSWSTAHARGIVTRDLVTGEIERTPPTRWCSGTGGYGNVFYLSTNAKGCNVTAAWRATSAAPSSPTPASRRSTPPASPSAATTSPSSR